MNSSFPSLELFLTQRDFPLSASWCSSPTECEGKSLRVAQYRRYVTSPDCMLVSKHPFALSRCIPRPCCQQHRMGTVRMSTCG